MPTTITSAGVTFNDTTTLTSATLVANSVGTTQITNGSVTAAKLGTTEQKQIAKAWVNFNGTLATPITPRASFNVSSITNNGTGDYTVNFATPMADANYAMVITTSQGIVTGYTGATYTVNAARFDTRQANTSTLVTPPINSVIVFGN